MDKAIELTNKEFESSTVRTKQYLTWHRTFKREFTKVLKEFATGIDISKPNHFDMSGFFKVKDQIWYFSIENLRWGTTFLIRTAEHYKDYSGGTNQFIPLNDTFEGSLKRVVGV